MPNHAVVVVSDEEGLAIRPATLLAHKDDEVHFQNLTDYSVVIKFDPSRSPFTWNDKPLASREKSNERVTQLTVAGSFPYEVEVIIGNNRVNAHASRPKIIIHDIII